MALISCLIACTTYILIIKKVGYYIYVNKNEKHKLGK